MYGYSAQQAAAYGGYGNYAQNSYANQQQQPQQATGQITAGATSSLYSSTAAGYSYPTAASAYAQYGQSASAAAATHQQHQQQSSTPVGYQTPQPPPIDYNTDYASMFKAGSYSGMTGAVGGGISNAAVNANRSAGGTPAAMMGSTTATMGTFGGVGTSSGNMKPNGGGATVAAASHYSGYEAAVYAAANSYLQQRNTAGVGQTASNQWMGGGASVNKRSFGAPAAAGMGMMNKFQANKFQNKFTANKFPMGGNNQISGGGGYTKKRYGLGHQNREVTAHYCEVCKVSCGGSQTYKEHLEGKLHKKKEALSRGDNAQSLPRLKVSFKCDVCNVTCTGRDTYDAHVKGVKHQKTVTLLKKMNKPIPALEPTLIPPKDGVPAVLGAASKKIVGVTGAKFVAGSKLSTTGQTDASDADPTAAAVEQALLAESNVKPVGEEFIDEQRDAGGKLIQYNCKLCDCKFSDPNAKEIHLKGRRHRLQYKQKVNPALEVETKVSGAYARKHMQQSQLRRGVPQPLRPFLPPPIMDSMPHIETSDDHHIIAKATAIQLSNSEYEDVEKLVAVVEKTLKSISDKFAVDESGAQPAAITDGDGKSDESERLLKGVMRVGLLAKSLLLKTDKEKEGNEKVTVSGKPSEAGLLVQLSDIPFVCRVTLTCVLIREANSAKADGSTANESPIEIPADALPTEPCLRALAELRHAKWYQVKCLPLSSLNMTLKIVRDISTRVGTWAPLSNWAMELLVEKALSSIHIPLSPGDAIRRLFETIAGGIILEKTPMVTDPCEKETVDVFGNLKNQEREDITSSAQHALRLIAFNQIYKILSIERIPDRQPLNGGGDRKRPRESNGLSTDGSSDAKKDKKEEDNGMKQEPATQ